MSCLRSSAFPSSTFFLAPNYVPTAHPLYSFSLEPAPTTHHPHPCFLESPTPNFKTDLKMVDTWTIFGATRGGFASVECSTRHPTVVSSLIFGRSRRSYQEVGPIKMNCCPVFTGPTRSFIQPSSIKAYILTPRYQTSRGCLACRLPIPSPCPPAQAAIF